jgi:hypothetical protein
VSDSTTSPQRFLSNPQSFDQVRQILLGTSREGIDEFPDALQDQGKFYSRQELQRVLGYLDPSHLDPELRSIVGRALKDWNECGLNLWRYWLSRSDDFEEIDLDCNQEWDAFGNLPKVPVYRLLRAGFFLGWTVGGPDRQELPRPVVVEDYTQEDHKREIQEAGRQAVQEAGRQAVQEAGRQAVQEAHREAPAPQPASQTPPQPVSDDAEDIQVVNRWPRFDDAMFHGLAGDIVELAMPHTEADPVGILVQFLVAFGNVSGRSAFYRIGPSLHHLNFNVVLVGHTSVGRKGTALDVALERILPADPVWFEDRIGNGLVSGEAMISQVRNERTRVSKGRGQNPDKIVTDPGVADKRLMLVETEISRLFKVMSAPTNTLSAVIRQLFDSGNASVMSKHYPEKTTGAHVSIIAHTTQADINRYLDATDLWNGFANRFLWVLVRRSKTLPDGGGFQSVEWSEIDRGVKDRVKFARSAGRINLDSNATEIWREVYRNITQPSTGLLSAIVDRAPTLILRMAGNFALLDCTTTINEDHLYTAMTVMDYSWKSVKLIFRENKKPREADQLLVIMRNHPEGLTRTQISRCFQGHKNKHQIGAILSELLTNGLIYEAQEVSPGGRTIPVWKFGRAPRNQDSREEREELDSREERDTQDSREPDEDEARFFGEKAHESRER